MTMTKNAVGNLIARYKTVLQNCSLLNTFGSLAAATVLAGAVVLGGATGAMAEDETPPLIEVGSKDFYVAGGDDTTFSTTDGYTNVALIGGEFRGADPNDSAQDGEEMDLSDDSGMDTNITTTGNFDEVIGGSYYRLAVTDDTAVVINIRNTSVTLLGDTDSTDTDIGEYVVGGSKLALSVGGGIDATVTTGTTTVVVGESGDDNNNNIKIEGTSYSFDAAIIGGNYLKTNATGLVDSNDNDVTFTASTEGTSVTIYGGTIGNQVIAGSFAQYWEPTVDFPDDASISVTDVDTSMTIYGGIFDDNVYGGAGASVYTTQTASANITATVLGDATTVISGGTFKSDVFGGGYAYGLGTASYVNGEASLTISGGTFVSAFGGGYAANGGTSTVGSTELTISGTATFSAAVAAGGYADGDGEATVGSTVLKISSDIDADGNYTTTFAGPVIGGGYATDGGTSDVGSTSVSITGGKFTGKVFAGGYATGTGSSTSVESTSIIITGGTFSDNIVAGGYATSSASSTVTGNTYLEISGDIDMSGFDGDIVGGGEASSSATANVEGNTTVIIGEDVKAVQGNVYGGGMVNAATTEGSSTANVEGSTKVEIYGDTLESVFGGGRARVRYAGSASANIGTEGDNNSTTNVTIYSSATVYGVAGGGWAHNYGGDGSAAGTAEANVYGDTYVTINGTVNKFSDATAGSIYLVSDSTLSVAVVGGGVASAYTEDNAIADVTGSTNVVINDGAYIDGDIVGGGMVYLGANTGVYGTANVEGDTNITINGGTITGNVYAGGYVESGTDSSASANVTGTATVTILGGTFGGYDEDGETWVDSTLYGEQGTSATVGTAILNLGSDSIAYSGTFAGIVGFDEVNISAGSAITLTGADTVFAKDSILSLGSGASLNATAQDSAVITVNAGAILDLSKTSGTVTINDVDFGDDVTTSADAWGWDASAYNEDSETLVTSALTSVTSVTWTADDSASDGTGTYTVVLGAASTDAIAEALGSSTSSGTVALVAAAMDNADANPAAASFILAAAEQEDGGTIIEGATKLAATAAVVPGLGSVNAAAGANMGTRTSIVPQAKARAQSDTSNWLAMNGDGAILPTADGGNMAQGFGIWFMPMYNHTSADGFKSDSYSYGYDTDIVGATLGADYTFASDLRLGLAFNVGQGSSTSTGDFATTENDFDYVGISVYGAKHFDALGLSFDMGYTVSENEMVQDATDGDLYGDVDASLFTLGVKAEYLIPLQSFNVTPYAGVRFNYYDVDGYDTHKNGDALFSTASSDNTVWEFPVGVTFDTTTQVGSWDFTPSLGLGVKFTAGDLDADQEVSIAGDPNSVVLSSEVADEVTFQGALGLGFAKDNCTIGLNYTLDLSENVESHGVSVNLRYDF